MPTADNGNEQAVITFFETLSTGELERVRPLLHADCAWQVMPTSIPGAGTHRGRDVIIDEFLAPVRGLFEPGDPKVIIDTVISKGDLVAVESRGVGKLKNGKAYNNTYCWMIEVKDGLIHTIREYMDSYHVSTLVDD
jgi:hypothetical protein